MKIALLITSIERQNLLVKCIESWCSILPKEGFVILVGEQGACCQEAINTLSDWGGEFEHYALPYDVGISASRNFLVEKAHKRNCEYVIITADSIHACDKFSITKLKQLVKLIKNELALVGFDIEGRAKWCWDLHLSDRGFELERLDDRRMVKTMPPILMVDMCANFFIAQTAVLLDNKWDEDLKLCEHEDFFWRLMKKGFLCAWTDAIGAKYVKERNAAYSKLRDRLYSEFKVKLMKKYNISGWFKIRK